MGFKKTACETCGESIKVVRIDTIIDKGEATYRVIYSHHVYNEHEPVPIQVDLATRETKYL